MPAIALVVNAYPRLSESFIANKVRLLADSGYAVTLIVHDLKADAMPPNLVGRAHVLAAPSAHKVVHRLFDIVRAFAVDTGACVELWRKAAGLGFRRQLKMLELYAPFAGRHFDIIHFSFSGLGVAYLPILLFLKKKSKLYVSCRGHAEQIRPLSDPIRKVEIGELFSVIDRVHCVSEDMLHTCSDLGLDEVKAFVNRPAIDPAMFSMQISSRSGGEKDKEIITTIVSVGRLHWKKGFEFLLQAFQILLAKGIKARLEIVGAGPEREKLIFMTHLLGVSEFVTFRGALSHVDIQVMLANADIYAQSSLSEGISNAVMEAMAMELPVVSTDVGGMSELITDSIDGFLVPALNPDSLAEKLILLAQDSELRNKLGQNARLKILKDFSLERQRDVYLTEYANAIATRS